MAIRPPAPWTASVTVLWLAMSSGVKSPAAPGNTPPSRLGAIPPVTMSPAPPAARSA